MGVHHTGYVFAEASVIFRETSCTDTGLDAEIELVKDGFASGQLAKLQIRSGDSRVKGNNHTFTFSDDRDHYEYWAGFTLPTFGIVYSPSLKTAIWFDLSGYSERVIAANGPYTITIDLTEDSRLDVPNIAGSLSDIVRSFSMRPVSLREVTEAAIVEAVDEAVAGPEELSKEQAWKYLTNVLLASDSAPSVRAEAGYRLSYYFPSVPEEQKQFFVERISSATDKEIVNVVIAIQDALSSEQDHAAEQILDLLSYMPDPVGRLKELARNHVVPEEALEALIKSVEVMTQEFDDGFRSEILNVYGLTDTDVG